MQMSPELRMPRKAHACCLVAIVCLVLKLASAQSTLKKTVWKSDVKTSVWNTERARILPSFGSSCNFLCYSGIFSSADGCTCFKHMCTAKSCRSSEVCQTRTTKYKTFALCCPRKRHKVCWNRPRYNMRFGRRFYFYSHQSNTCHAFRAKRFDRTSYFTNARACLRQCKCRQPDHNRRVYQ
ncbi:uncharacterized protein [Haliotis cracherodii]|uniref:uncharacterized protein n=1 Tax=Haliotis cracherodii TaxID=6455 RepID=UPI0039EC3A37